VFSQWKSFAQCDNISFGVTKDEIIKQCGTNYVGKIANDGTKFITYQRKLYNDEMKRNVEIIIAYYFMDINEKEIYVQKILLLPKSEANGYISIYNDKFVKLGYLFWKDYAENILYEVKFRDSVCSIIMRYDYYNVY
jgi:hypothetical protein